MSKRSWDITALVLAFIFAVFGGGFIFATLGSNVTGAVLAFSLGIFSASLKDTISDWCYRRWPDKE